MPLSITLRGVLLSKKAGKACGEWVLGASMFTDFIHS